MKNDELGIYDEETYTKGLSREETIEKQIRICIYNYSLANWDNFEYSLKALIALLPLEIRKRFPPLKHNTTAEGVENHYTQFVKIQETLETDTNMVFKKKFIKTYE